jgi:hypothetical protein
MPGKRGLPGKQRHDPPRSLPSRPKRLGSGQPGLAEQPLRRDC